MILIVLLAVLLVGGVLCALVARGSAAAARGVALGATLADLGVALALWVRHYGELSLLGGHGRSTG
jgi:NADH:ubiquinone oxidoreductase subunit 4 (subunit M)